MQSAPPQVGISVIVPFFRAEATIGACLASLLRQRDVPEQLEFLLVDNNSGDRSAAIAESFGDSRVRVLAEPKQGAYAARNRALAEARGAVVVFTDPDCEAEETWLRELTAPFEDPTAGIVLGRVVPCRLTPLLATFSEYERTKEAFVLGADIPELCFGRTSNMAVRRSLLDDVGRFVERARGGDTDFVRRAVRRHGTRVIRYRPSARVRHSEVASIRDYLAKVMVYARSSKAPGAEIAVPLLTRAQRFRLVCRTCSEQRFGPIRFAALVGVLAAEGLVWRIGRLQG